MARFCLFTNSSLLKNVNIRTESCLVKLSEIVRLNRSTARRSTEMSQQAPQRKKGLPRPVSVEVVDELFSNASDRNLSILQPSASEIDTLLADRSIWPKPESFDLIDETLSSESTDEHVEPRAALIPVTLESIEDLFSEDPQSTSHSPNASVSPIQSSIPSSFSGLMRDSQAGWPDEEAQPTNEFVVQSLLKLFAKHLRHKTGQEELLKLVSAIATPSGLEIPQSSYLFKRLTNRTLTTSFNFTTPCCNQAVFDFKTKKTNKCPADSCQFEYTSDLITSQADYSFK